MSVYGDYVLRHSKINNYNTNEPIFFFFIGSGRSSDF